MFRFLFLIFIIALYPGVSDCKAQSNFKKAGEIVQRVFTDYSSDSAAAFESESSILERIRQDSLKLHDLNLKLQEMKLNEIVLRNELAVAEGNNLIEDSLKKVNQMKEIDSLRAVTKGVPVVIEEDTLFILYASMGGRSAMYRAERIEETITRIGKEGGIKQDTIHSLDGEMYSDIMYGDEIIMSVTDSDALWVGKTRSELMAEYIPVLAAKIKYLRNENSLWQIVRRLGLFVLVIVVQCLIFKFVNFLFHRLRRQIIRYKQEKIRSVVVKGYELLNKKRLTKLLLLVGNLLRCFILLMTLILTVPILFAIFPQTENLAMRIFYYILDPVKMVLRGVIDYIPNLFIIVVIWCVVRYIVKGFRYISSEISNERLRIAGFYPEWAQPTFNIVRFLLYAFMIAMIYPYLPGAKSGVFQGISVFVGLIVSLGSSSVISNFIAGFVITYMRPFKAGDFIKVKDTVGNVIEKTPFVTRLRTIKNEVVTIPNSFIMSSDTVNYSISASKDGLIIHTMMTMVYDVPWRKVHELLIEAALKTRGVMNRPRPFVLETDMNDNYMCYQINAYIRNADDMPRIKSDLLQNIQDLFNEAGIDMVATHFYDSRSNMLHHRHK